MAGGTTASDGRHRGGTGGSAGEGFETVRVKQRDQRSLDLDQAQAPELSQGSRYRLARAANQLADLSMSKSKLEGSSWKRWLGIRAPPLEQ